MSGRANIKNLSLYLKSSIQYSSQTFHLSLDLIHKKKSHCQKPIFKKKKDSPSTMHSSLVLASLLPLLASANPVPLQSRQTTPTPFGLIAARSTTPIHLQSVNANGQRFWIGKETATFCPSDVVPDCPPGTSTELLAADGTASLVSTPNPLTLLFFPFFSPRSQPLPPSNQQMNKH